MVTNTLVITSDLVNAGENAALELLREFLEDTVLTRFHITQKLPLQLVALPALQRAIIVCPTHEIAQSIADRKEDWPQLAPYTFRFSMIDATSGDSPRYLELPKHKALFLVSPPTSPPPEFDYSRLEESPNRHKGLWPVSCARDIKTDPEHCQKEERHHVLLKHPNASITLDSVPSAQMDYTVSVGSDSDQFPTIDRFRTAVPPRSVFDDIE
ncbi:LADA_0E07624g1_1 [Lachancea dasiensis]|uniref:LADA_0E07624g1_1 n=1 Tax=Lachancea dasiensis TaxID=1072105 RepID=A0A1G4JCX0_9SACH|nr:LADA_0E07624g1_1 [Lachancea dasiensis]